MDHYKAFYFLLSSLLLPSFILRLVCAMFGRFIQVSSQKESNLMCRRVAPSSPGSKEVKKRVVLEMMRRNSATARKSSARARDEREKWNKNLNLSPFGLRESDEHRIRETWTWEWTEREGKGKTSRAPAQKSPHIYSHSEKLTVDLRELLRTCCSDFALIFLVFGKVPLLCLVATLPIAFVNCWKSHADKKCSRELIKLNENALLIAHFVVAAFFLLPACT